MIKSIFSHRKYIFQNAISNFRYQYAGSVIGVFWNFINPLVESIIYIFIFSYLLKFRSPGRADNYGLYLISGLFPWFIFSELLIHGTNAYYKNRNLLISLSLPLDVPLAIEFVSSYINSLIYYFLLVLINLISGTSPNWIWLLWPIFSVVLLLLAYSLSVILAVLRVFFSDISELIRHLLHLWRWTMPIIYTADVFPEKMQPFLRINPPYTFIEVLRGIFLENALPTTSQLLIMAFWLVVIFLIANFLHARYESEVRDNL